LELIAAPAPFASLEVEEAGRVVALFFFVEACFSLLAAALWLLLDRGAGRSASRGLFGCQRCALDAHGLIKVRMFADAREARAAALEQLAHALGAAPVQHIGKLLVLYRPAVSKPAIEKTSTMPGPRVVKILKFAKSGNHRPQIKKVKVFGNQRVTPGGSIKRAKPRATSIKKTAS
jgi:hypothetical protein